MKVILHRIRLGGYFVGDAPLTLGQSGGSWEISPLHDANEPESITWLERNRAMFEGNYPRLRDARAMLEVVFEMDPPPSFDMVPMQWFSKEDEGYSINVPGGVELRVRRDAERGEWIVLRETVKGRWREVNHAASLWMIRSARTDIVRLAQAQEDPGT